MNITLNTANEKHKQIMEKYLKVRSEYEKRWYEREKKRMNLPDDEKDLITDES